MALSNEEMRQIRGDRIRMIFQQPTSSLNPVRDVDWQIGEVLELHRKMTGPAAHERALELLRMVGIPDPARRLKSFPHELSGGMAQRVMIARRSPASRTCSSPTSPRPRWTSPSRRRSST